MRPATVPTVVPSKPVVVGGAKCGAGPRGKPAVGVAVGGAKGERKKQTREIHLLLLLLRRSDLPLVLISYLSHGPSLPDPA